MEDHELEFLLDSLESDRVERKSALSEKDKKEKVCQAICAFANDLPNHGTTGVVFIGAKDDGNPSKIDVTDDLLLQLADLRSNGNILPFPAMRVEQRILKGAPMAVVFVEPSDAPPVRYQGRTWIRVGPRRAIATREEERRLSEKRRVRDLPFELLAAEGASLSDLDEDLFRRTYLPSAVDPAILAENDRSYEQRLTSLRFATPTPSVPTNLGILAVGVDSRQFVPGAYIQFLRVEGTELTDPIKDQAEVGGALPHMLALIDEKTQAHISISTDVTSASKEIRHPDYPRVALQQLIRNAVLHRTYDASNAPVRIYWFSDRIEIHNPGGPFGSVTQENFGQPGITDYRNAYLAEVMKNLGYVQRFGMGIQLARKQLGDNGNPPPEFIVKQENVVAILRRSP